MMNKKIKSTLCLILTLYWVGVGVVSLCFGSMGQIADDEQKILDDTFRIDIKSISVVFDYVPDEYYSDCKAEITFVMRPNQTKPLIHLDPALRNLNIIQSIHLNNDILQPSDTNDVQVIQFADSSQGALEFQRYLEEEKEHVLKIQYRLNFQEGYPRFSSVSSDIRGRGNEEFFPTINTPHELARHILTFRVHGERLFRCMGSGSVRQIKSDAAQEWVLETERELSSYTVMFVLVPFDDMDYQERIIEGVMVRVMAFKNDASIEGAFSAMEELLPYLISNLGSFPSDNGISIFL